MKFFKQTTWFSLLHRMRYVVCQSEL